MHVIQLTHQSFVRHSFYFDKVKEGVIHNVGIVCADTGFEGAVQECLIWFEFILLLLFSVKFLDHIVISQVKVHFGEVLKCIDIVLDLVFFIKRKQF